MSYTPTLVTEEIYGYILKTFAPEDDFMKNLQKEAIDAGMPAISISPDQAKFLQFIVKANKAERILEIGSLAGYSAISMGRVLPDGGLLTAVEIEPVYAEFIRRKVKEDGLEDKIEVVNKSGLDYLHKHEQSETYDLIFIDAEKVDYVEYFRLAQPLLRKGGIFAADNCFAFGEIAKRNPLKDLADIEGIRKFNLALTNNPGFFSVLVASGDGTSLAIKL